MEAFEKRAASNLALQRGGDPQEIVGAAIYLCSDASSFTSGSVLAVDGGTY
jgi:NAD(P)-dependent dehydrogenase (short-subunit alcohol dehydrogenase family)